MAFVKILLAVFWAAVFLALLLFAIKNAEPVTLHFYFDQSWDAPLVFVVLLGFAAGAAFGVIACVPPLLRQRREIVGLREQLKLRPTDASLPAPPSPATVPDLPTLP
jgi:uncharacterized integral membrane protein